MSEPRKVKVGSNEWGDIFLRVPADEILASKKLDPLLVVPAWAQSEWHYPPRCNARPGLYESECHRIWWFDFEEGGQWFIQTKPNHYESRHLPTWQDNADGQQTPVAVRWIGELDAEEEEEDAVQT